MYYIVTLRLKPTFHSFQFTKFMNFSLKETEYIVLYIIRSSTIRFLRYYLTPIQYTSFFVWYFKEKFENWVNILCIIRPGNFQKRLCFQRAVSQNGSDLHSKCPQNTRLVENSDRVRWMLGLGLLLCK